MEAVKNGEDFSGPFDINLFYNEVIDIKIGVYLHKT